MRTEPSSIVGCHTVTRYCITSCKGVLGLLKVSLTFGTDFTSLLDEVYLRQLRSQTTQSNNEKFAWIEKKLWKAVLQMATYKIFSSRFVPSWELLCYLHLSSSQSLLFRHSVQYFSLEWCHLMSWNITHLHTNQLLSIGYLRSRYHKYSPLRRETSSDQQ